MNKVILKRSLCFFIATIFFFSCGNNSDKNTVTTPKPDSTVATAPPANTVVAPASLQDLLIDTSYFNEKAAKAKEVIPAAWSALGLPKIIKPDQLKDPGNKIKILDTLVFTSQGLLLLLARETENEHWAWVIQYDSHGVYQSHKLVFYEDFVEYFSTTSTRIKDSTLFIKTQTNSDDNSSEKTEKYKFTDGHKLELIK